MSILKRLSSIGWSVLRAVQLRNQRAALRHMLELDSDRLADIGLTKSDLHRAMRSSEPLAVIYEARDRHAREKPASRAAALWSTKGMPRSSAPHRPQDW